MAASDRTERKESTTIFAEQQYDLPKRRYTYTFSTQPLEIDLKKLLVQVTDKTDLKTISEVKMKVVTSQAGLHRLAHYTPQLKILILDGSCVSSFRDLGSSLKSLTTLSVVRCNLKSLDGICGFRNLEELTARDNFITNPSPCSGARRLVKLDLANNDISDVTCFLFLQTCRYLRDLSIARNKFDDYTDIIRTFLPQVRVLDGQEVEMIEGGAVIDEGRSSDEVDLTSEDDSQFSFLDDADVNQMDDPHDSVYSDDDDDDDNKDSVEKKSDSDSLSRFCDFSTRDDEPLEVSRWETNSQIKLQVQGDTLLKKLSVDGPCFPIHVIPDELTAISDMDINTTNVVHDVLPSKLTTGRVVCGNLAASLRTRNPTRNVFTLPQIKPEVRIEEPN